MPQTQLGQKIEGWSAGSKEEFKNDLNKLATVPLDALRTVVDKIAKTHPSCNVLELAALEVEQRNVSDLHELSDAISVWTYIWENISSESPQAVSADLVSLGLVSAPAAGILTELLTEAEPFRETARVTSRYIRVGAPLFVGLRGTVDIRCRFHKTEEDFTHGKSPSELVDVHQVILVNLELHTQDDEETVISFLMDENDLSYMKRFVRNMERELELSKGLLKS
jgi:hypothetical protein